MSSVKDLWAQVTRSLRDNDLFAGASARKAPYLVVALFIAFAHVGSSWLGYLLLSGGAQVTPVFPEAGLDLVILLLFGTRYWPVLFAAYFATSLWRHVPWLPSLGVASASLLRTVVAVWLFRWISGMKKVLGHFVDLVGVTLAAAVAPKLGAALGTLCLIAGGRFPHSQWLQVFNRWWVADSLGIWTLAPVLLVLARSAAGYGSRLDIRFVLKIAAFTSGVGAACYLIFFWPDTSYLLFSVFVLILIAAAWMGPTAARVSALAIASAAIWATHTGVGAFTGGTLRDNLRNLDLFLIAISLTGIAVGAFRSIGNLALPGGVLLAGWVLSGWLYASLDVDRVREDEARFDKIISSVETGVQARLNTYEDALRGASGLLAASNHVSSQDWHTYVSHLGLLNRFPGTTVMSIVQPVAAANGQEERLLVIAAEPEAIAARAVGGDLARDPRRKAAADLARDSGAMALTQITNLLRGDGKGIQVFVPVYRAGAPIETAADRRSAIVALVSVVFRADLFFRGALGEVDRQVSFIAYDDDPSRPGSLMFSSAGAPLQSRRVERTTRLSLGGTEWTFGWSRLPGFPGMSKTPSAWAAGCTALLSLLLAGLVLTLQATGRRAANRLKLVQSALALGTWEIDFGSRSVLCSPQLLRLYGMEDSRERLALDEWLTRVHSDDREHRTVASSAHGEDRTIDRQYRAVWPDGSVHWLHSKALVVFDDQQRPSRVVGVDFDITEHKRVEERVRILSSAVEQSPVSVLITGLDGKVEYANAKLTESTGYTLDELKGREWDILAAPETAAEHFAEIAETIQTGEWSGVIQTRRKNGELFWEAARILLIRDSSGNPIHRLTVAEDITERLEMDAALKISEERFRIAAESSGDSIYEWDLESDGLYVLGSNSSRSFADDWAPPATYREFAQIVHPADRKRVQTAIERSLQNGESYRVEYRIILPGGDIRDFADQGSRLLGKDGRPYKWIGVWRDITDQKIVERANAELAAIVECADTAIISLDLDGEVLTWNQGAERVYGFHSEEMVGRNMAVLLPPDRLSEEAEILEKLRRGETVNHLETTRLTKPGKPIDVLLTISPIRDRFRNIIGAAHVAWDTTETKQLQRQLAQAQKLESVGQLAAGVAHEINTPIQYVGDNGKFLEEAFRDLMKFAVAQPRCGDDASHREAVGLDDGILEYLQQEVPKAITQLLEGVDQVARIVRAMKEFSHPGPIEKAAVDINRAIESTIIVSKSEWKYVTDVTTDFDPELPLVPCVPGEFNQVMLNLIVNAAHAIADVVRESGGKGKIHITTRNAGNNVEIRVSDTGCGIPEDVRSKVFDPFFTTKPVGKGTGQGLAIAHSVIVQKHGGAISVESEPGRGTTFIIELPLACELEAA